MQLHPEATRAITVESIRAATVGGAVVTGLTLDGVLKILSIGFVLLQAAYVIWKWRRDWRSKQKKRPVTVPADK